MPLLVELRTMTAARSTPITRAGGRLPCRPTNSCGYQQGQPYPYLISRLLFEELDFRTTGYLSASVQVSGPPYTGGIHMSCRSDTIPCAGTVGSPDSLPLWTPVGLGSYQQVKPGGVTLDGTLEVVQQRHQRSELKRNILVSPRWCFATEPATRVKYESNHS